MKKYTAFFTELSLKDMAQVGGKGANLGELSRAGLPVPPGFCVTLAGFDDFVAAHDLFNLISQIVSGIDFNNLNDVEAKTARIREMVCNVKIPDEIASEIKEAYRKLQGDKEAPLVAVRSSVGTRDLSRSSFPGQMDTYHNLRDAENVLAKVRECWASLWTARAASSINAMRIDHKQVFIAPLVQLMVAADVSGVLFTANPINANPDEMVINANFGLGESVVSGSITPDQYVVAKTDFKILSAEPGTKSFKVELDEEKGSGTRKTFLSEEEARKECLTPAQIKELAELGVKIEKHYDFYQDVEWAYVAEKLYVLQSRRISGLDRVKEDAAPEEWISELDTKIKDPPETYSSANISEVLPGVITPLSLYNMKAMDYGFWKPNYDIGLMTETLPEGELEYLFFGMFYGRAHLNMSAFNRIISKIPGGTGSEFDRPFPTDEQAPKLESPKFSLSIIPYLFKVLFKSMQLRYRVPRELACQTEMVHQRVQSARNQNFAAMQLKDFADIFDKTMQQSRDLMALHIANSQLAAVNYGLLCKLTKRWLADEAGSFAARLVTGLSTLESARPNFGIYRLYRFVAASDGLKKLFLQSDSAEIASRLKRSRSNEAKEFNRLLDEFLREYGSRSVSEAEMMLPAWEEDPSFLFSMIQNFLRADRVEDPAKMELRQQQDRVAAITEARRKLNPVKRIIFNLVLKEAQTFIAGRENNKAIVMKWIHEDKRIFSEIKRRLLAKRILTEGDDLYFLTFGEIMTLCRGGEVDAAALIPPRKVDYHRNQNVILPETFTGRPRPMARREEEIPATNILRGLPVSPGRVTGPARVIFDPRKDAQIKSGEILVAPITDTGWTPLFLMAKAIVVDVGGLLSHGSIVAREYGIPGVLNVMVGTKVIKTGQIITVDGDKGEVYLH